MQKKYNIIHVYEFLGMQSLRIGLILVLEGVVFHFIWLKYLLGTVITCSDIYFEHFCLKIQNEVSKKKKPTLVFQYFGSVGKGLTNIFSFFFRPEVQQSLHIIQYNLGWILLTLATHHRGRILTRIRESILPKILVGRVARLQIESCKRKCEVHKIKWRRIHRFSQKSMWES